VKNILVTGAGGFIGGWLTKNLLQNPEVNLIAVDLKPIEQWYQVFDTTNLVMDLRQLENTRVATRGIDEVYNLAADMGGMGFIENNKAECMLSSLINTHMLLSARENNASKFFFASSACVYNDAKQKETINPPLTESDAYPAAPEDGYGWEKLFSERMCRHFYEDFGLAVRVARFHNIYGPNGTWSGGREKAPAAICRKVATAVKSGVHEINIWGDGEQTRSYTFISDAVEGVNKLMKSDFTSPLNIGSSELVSIDQLVTIVENIAGIKLKRTYDLKAPKGVRGRSSDNSLCKKVLDWEPKTTLIDGISETYKWIFDKVI
jgi:nucleoside-diphosphate-sugar epimerase